MAGTSWSSSSSCTSSFGSLDDDDVVCVIKPGSAGAAAAAAAVAEGSLKFLCSYGGRILPRHTDGTLRYVGGDNRVLSVDRSIRFHELQLKLRELCGSEAYLRCQLPTEDLDALISVTCDDDLANLLEEYDEASKDRLQSLKIRAFLFPRTPVPASSMPRSAPPPDSRPSSSATAAHLHWQNTSAAAEARVSPTCAPRWWAAPQASRQSQNYDRHSLGEERPHTHRYLVHNHNGRQWQ